MKTLNGTNTLFIEITNTSIKKNHTNTRKDPVGLSFRAWWHRGCCWHLVQAVYDAIDANAPFRKKRIKHEKQPEWLTPEILGLVKSRDQLLKKAKSTNTDEDWKALKDAKSKATSAFRSAKKNYFRESINNNRNKPKQLWKTLKDLCGRNKNSSSVSFLEEDGTQIHSPEQIAEILNNHFTSVAARLKNSNSLTSTSIRTLSYLYHPLLWIWLGFWGHTFKQGNRYWHN